MPLLAIWIAWIPNDGGYFARDWYPGALFAVALLGAMVLAGGRAGLRSRSGTLVLSLLGALTALSFLSMIWAEWRGPAWDGSNQLLLYLATAWAIALVPWRTGAATAFLGAWSVAVAVLCGAELVSALRASDLDHYLFESRWQQPTGYANAAAALPAMALWPALMVASRRRTPAWLQIVFLAVAAFLATFSLLPQSRAWLVVVVVVTPVFVALAPERARLLGRLAVVGLAVGIAAGPAHDVFQAGEQRRPLAPAVDHAAEWIALGVGVAVWGALVLLALERLLEPSERSWRQARTVSVATLAGVLLAGGVFGAVHAGDIVDEVGDQWRTFKSENVIDEGPRLTRQSSNKRYDYWRVAVDAVADAPVGGVGTGNFEREYTAERRYVIPSRSAHSVWMRSLAEGGLLGVGLFAALVGAMAAALCRAYRRLDEGGRWVVAACAAPGAYFLCHASVDWLELMPALAAPAVALPFVALALADAAQAGEPEHEPEGRTGPAGRRFGFVGGAAAAVALLSLLLPYLSIRYVDNADDRAASDLGAARRDLDRAATLNPLSGAPHLARGTLAIKRGEFAAAEAAFEDAVEIEDAWYPHYTLALLAAERRDFATARRQIARAAALNQPDPLVSDTSELIDRRRRIDPRTHRRGARLSGLK